MKSNKNQPVAPVTPNPSPSSAVADDVEVLERGFEDFKAYVFSDAKPDDWRRGQFVFNYLREMRPDLSEQIRTTDLDPFYQDERLVPFFEWLLANWSPVSSVERDKKQDLGIPGGA